MPRRGLPPMRHASVPWSILEQEQGCLDSDGSWPVSYTHLDVYKRQTIAVHPLSHGACAGAVNQSFGVVPHQTHNAPELALAHPALSLKQGLAQLLGRLANGFGLAQDALGLPLRIE